MLKETNRSNKWHRLDFDGCYIIKRFAKSVLIRMPSRTDYDGYTFFHPSSLLKEYMDGTKLLSFPDTWTFKLKANGGAITAELSAAEFIEAADDYFGRYERRSSTHVPAKLEPVETEALEELIDND